MAYDESDLVWVDARAHPEAVEVQGILVAAIHGPLFFADAAACRAQILRMVGESDPSVVVLDLGTTPEIDIDGADTLTKVAGQLRSRGVRLVLARVDGERLELLRRAGTLEATGDEDLFVTVRAAVSADSRH